MIGVDANVLIRWVIDDGVEVGQVAEARGIVGRDAVYVSGITLVEVLWVLRSRYNVPASIRHEFVEKLLQNATVVVQHADAVQTALSDVAVYKGDLPDHLLATLNEEAGCRFTLTFDKKAGRSPKFKRLTAKGS